MGTPGIVRVVINRNLQPGFLQFLPVICLRFKIEAIELIVSYETVLLLFLF